MSVLWLRKQEPHLPRPFRAPGGRWTPIFGILASTAVAAPVLVDMVDKARRGDFAPGIILMAYLSLGARFYAAYGYRASRLARAD